MLKRDEQEENDLTIPNAEIIKDLTAIVGEADAQKFLKFAHDLESGSIELST